MEEQTILEEGGVKVTSARFVLPAQTYAMANITSVKNYTEPANQAPAILIGLAGLVSLFFGSTGVILGIVLLGFAALAWFSAKPVYHILLATSGGEVRALSSRNQEYIARVVKGINDAMVARG